MASLEEVARRAQVSTATASRALNGRGRVSDATRARVRDAADALGYVVSASASSLATGRTLSIGVLVPLLDRWFYSSVLDGIATRLAPRGYDLTLYNLTDSPEQRRHLFQTSLRRGRVDAVVALSLLLTDDEIDQLLALRLPVVGLGAPSPRLATLRVDDTAVARTATGHLLDLGHRRIAHIGQSTTEAAGSGIHSLDIPTLRRQGFEQALRDAGVEPAGFVAADFTIDGGHRAARELLAGPDRPTAIFAASDEMAFGALFAARELGLEVPGDLSVVGVDGHEMSDFFGLTTIAQFPHGQGERAAEAILGLLEDGHEPAGTALPFELVVRTSTSPPR
ncbi:LacI family DNA-binding transcriptional regulator [Microbacterium invictum]|uniref:DNA-binding LacI/PurR family transcriptional regulator n=1 Tax=Microbacterium invictum TaxID=515415 RepID=A0AA40VMJ7_9MICO|nr:MULTISPECIES: LacI family DNA-binding transcriptional regulator [Microbacterium]MBB4140521.1 DNA-binding LacI/PurR family transcriptional regulator [Microbacterium invictum]